jgi:hypothetical protein
MVKRVAAVPGAAVPESVREAAGGARVVPAGMLVVLADNAAATDSRRWGFVAASEILGPVVLRLPRRGGRVSQQGRPRRRGGEAGPERADALTRG